MQNLAAFLLSDGCDWLTGETIAMDGAQALATGGNFYELRKWGDAEWKAAREGDRGAERARPRNARLTADLVAAIADCGGHDLGYNRYLSSAVNLWIFLHASSSAVSEVA